MMLRHPSTWIKILQTYAENEDNNYHAENAVLLAKALGSPPAAVAELEEQVLKCRRGEGLSAEDISRRAELTKGHYHEACARRDAVPDTWTVRLMDNLARYWQRNKKDPVRILSDAYSCDDGRDLAGWRESIEAGYDYECEKLKTLEDEGILGWWFTLDSESKARLTRCISKGGA